MRYVVEPTSAEDRRNHLVTVDALGDVLQARTGHCVALCGHDVRIGALGTPPAPPCSRCEDVRSPGWFASIRDSTT